MKLSALLLGTLLPAAALAVEAEAPRCVYAVVAKLPVRYVGAGLAPAVDGSINGTPATMLVDTGAFDTQLTMNGATRRDLGMERILQAAQGVGGVSHLYGTRVREMTLGPIKTRRASFLPIIGQANITPAFDAVIGAPFLLQTDLEVDLRAKQLRFFRASDCDKTELNIWKEDTIAVPFDASSERDPNPHFTVKVNGVKLDAVIDTGAHHSAMTVHAAERVGIDFDGPGVKRTGYVGGIGAELAAQWSAAVKTVAIGDEEIRGAEIGIVESQGKLATDLLLGQDFLRTHRVLFAMGQRKVYIAYLGGTPFSRGAGLEPWMRAEADAGNPDAQYTVALMYGSGSGVAQDAVQADAWLDKAAAGGEPHANLLVGYRQLQAGHAAAAIPKLQAGLAQLPAERYGPLWLYAARLRNGEPELAGRELQASLKKQQDDDWPRPIAEFYLGKRDAAGLLGAAAREPKLARARGCQARTYMADWYGAQGDRTRAAALTATLRAECGAAPGSAGRETAP